MLALSAVAWWLAIVSALLVIGMAALVFFMTRGWLTLDLGWGRSFHPLGPISVRIRAPRDLVFEQIAAPYLGRTPKALRGKLEVWERDDELVVAAHRTKLRLFTSVTVEAVTFEPPRRIAFRHLRGPVPHAAEEFVLGEGEGETELEYRGRLGIDFWFLGWLSGRLWVVPTWERVVKGSMEEIRRGAEERAAARERRTPPRG